MANQNQIDVLTEAVPAELAGQRLDQALARMFPDYSRSRIKHWILQGHVTVDGREMRPRDAISAGAVIKLRPQPEQAVSSDPEPMELDVAYEDDALAVIFKPAGLVVHPGAGNMRGTLMNGLLHRWPATAELPRAGIVHRLDKDTSGLLIVAKTVPAHTALTRQMSDREISREYLAVCNGVLTGGGTINAPISRHPVDRRKMHVQEGGKEAITHYRVIERFLAHTYIRVRLETGRTHQIRVHFAFRRHALLGDQAYGGRLALPAGCSDSLRDMLRSFRRQALHAERLAFRHPLDGQPIELQRDAPKDFQALLQTLREDAS